jgi:hypothetical protein
MVSDAAASALIRGSELGGAGCLARSFNAHAGVARGIDDLDAGSHRGGDSGQAVAVEPPAGDRSSHCGAGPAHDGDALNRDIVARFVRVADDLLDVGPRNRHGRAAAAGEPALLSGQQDAVMVGAEGELAPGERDHCREGHDDADNEEDRLDVPQESQGDGDQAGDLAGGDPDGRPAVFFVAAWIGQHPLMVPRQTACR